MRVALAGVRGLLGGWLIAAALPLLVNAHSIAAWSASGLSDAARLALAALEIAGAALFAFEFSVLPGFVALLGSFGLAMAIHMQRNELPLPLVGYALAVLMLLVATRRARASQATVARTP